MFQFGASERISRVNWFSSGLQSAFRESIGSVRGFRAHFASQSVQFAASERISRVNRFCSGLQSAFRESIGSVRGFRARFASQSVQFGASERISRVNRFSSGLQSAFHESIGSVWGLRAHFASQLVQLGASERVSRVNWFSSGLQSAFLESIGSVRGFRACFASQLRASERVSRVNWFSSGPGVQPRGLVCIRGLKDAYFHIQIAPRHRRFSEVCCQLSRKSTAFQYSVLPSGLLWPHALSKCINAALPPQIEWKAHPQLSGRLADFSSVPGYAYQPHRLTAYSLGVLRLCQHAESFLAPASREIAWG